MTEKRYKVYSDSYSADIVDGLTKKNYNQLENFDDICDEMNALHEENTILKALLNKLSDKDGRIVLINGYGYNVKKILEDF